MFIACLSDAGEGEHILDIQAKSSFVSIGTDAAVVSCYRV